MLNGLKVRIDSNIGVTGLLPARTHKRKRINKKWLKRYGYKPQYKYACVVMNEYIIMNPYTFKMLKKEVPTIYE